MLNIRKHRTLASAALFLVLLATAQASATQQATQAEVADFWNTVFKGPAPNGVPPLNPSQTNRRTVDNTTVWDICFNSYRDPGTNMPLRICGVYAVPNNIAAPGPAGTYPGLVHTHSVGGCATCGSPTLEGQETAVFYAKKGYAALSYFGRGYPGSTFANPGLNMSSNTAMCINMVDDGQKPFDVYWTGVPMDIFQAGEFMAQQSEVWVQQGLSFIGHSLGGYIAVMAGIFSERYKVIAASAAPTSGSDVPGSLPPGNPISWCVGNLGGNLAANTQLAIRMSSFIGVYQAINNPLLVAKDPTWKLDNTQIFFYGGQADTAVRPQDVQDGYRLADASNNKALHWSPTGGHGGPESYYRSRAWLAGHYPGIPANPPTAKLVLASMSGLTVNLSAAGSTDDDTMIAYDYDYGDGNTRNWGDTVSYSYAAAGTYTITLTVTDGEGRRDTDQIQVSVGGVAMAQAVVIAANPVVVQEGGTGSFTVALSAAPGRAVTINVTRASGDADLSIQGGATLTFNDQNWSQAQTVTVAAGQDADRTGGTGVFSVAGQGVQTVNVNVRENDDEARFSLSVGSASGKPGDTVSVDVSLANMDMALVRSLSVNLSFNETALGMPNMTRGATVPGPADWLFGATRPGADQQLIAGNQIAQPDGAAVNGVIATNRFTIPAGTASGIYPLTLVSGSVEARPATATTDGMITETKVNG